MAKPTIRFKGFDDEWEQRKLSEIALQTYGGGTPKTANEEFWKGNIPWIQSSDLIEERLFNVKPRKYISQEAISKSATKLVPQNSIAIVTRVGVGKLAFMPFSYATSQDFLSLSELKIESEFAVYALYKMMQLVSNEVQGTSIKGITKDELLAKEILIPDCEEQKKIGAYLHTLDSLITLHQRKCDETKKLKKYMLQKMFPQNGSKVPEIRFKGFTDEWEQRKFGEITELKSASRVHKDEWTSNGVPFYRSSDVMAAINGTENEKAFISEELYEKLSKVSGKLEEGDILVTGGGSVGNPYIVPDNKPLYTKDADLLWIKNKGKFHPYFLYEFFFSPTFRNYLGSISHVGTIAHYTITQLSDTPICLPSFDEQKEVGEYFQSLDNLITLHQHKCEELKKLKKFMLQNMFTQKNK